MIKFFGDHDKRPTVGLGFSFENLELLRQGKPVMIDLKEMNIGYDLKILVFADESEGVMIERFKKAGRLPQDLEMHEFADPFETKH